MVRLTPARRRSSRGSMTCSSARLGLTSVRNSDPNTLRRTPGWMVQRSFNCHTSCAYIASSGLRRLVCLRMPVYRACRAPDQRIERRGKIAHAGLHAHLYPVRDGSEVFNVHLHAHVPQVHPIIGLHDRRDGRAQQGALARPVGGHIDRSRRKKALGKQMLVSCADQLVSPLLRHLEEKVRRAKPG